MHIKIAARAILFIIASYVYSSYAAVELIDDFSESTVNCDKWESGTNSQFDISSASGRLRFSMEPYSTGEGLCKAMARIKNSAARTVHSMSTTVNMRELTYDSAMESVSFAMEGYFYNTRTDLQRSSIGDNPASEGDSPVGEVWATVQFGDRGAGLEAWWLISKTEDTAYVSETTIAEGTLIGPGSLSKSTDYPISISYDGDKQFTFSFNGASSIANGPNKGGNLPPFRSLKRIGVRSSINSALTPTVGTRTVRADIGSLTVNGSDFDDFSPALDNSLWNKAERKAAVTASNTLRVEIHSRYTSDLNSIQRNEHSQTLPSIYSESKKLEASLKLIQVDNGTRGRTRLSGIWYNSDKTNGQYNGYQGNVFAQLGIERKSDGSYRAYAHAEHIADKLWDSSGDQLFFKNLSSVNIVPGVFYDVSIELTSTQLVFIVTDSTDNSNTQTYTHTITTPIYPVSPGTAYHQVQTRINDGFTGNMVAEVDNIRAEPATVGAENSATNPVIVVGRFGITSITNVGATAEPGEPYHGELGQTGTPNHSVWIDWTAPSSGTYTFDTNGSTFDTLLSVYTIKAIKSTSSSNSTLAEPSIFDNYVKEAGNNDASPEVVYSKVTFDATSGVTYHVAVDSNNEDTGGIILNYKRLEEDVTCFPVMGENGRGAVICL